MDDKADDWSKPTVPRVPWILTLADVTEYTQMTERMHQQMVRTSGIQMFVNPAVSPDCVIAMVNGELVGMITDIAPEGVAG